MVIQKPPPTPFPISTVTPTASPNAAPPVDYQLLLLSLAEEYISAAHGMGSIASLAQREADLEQYYKLMSTALRCLESVLKHFRLHPRAEATLRLRYASLLNDETDNNMEAETVLSKGITLCQRNRLFDLKYSMQHLLGRVLFKTNPRAALKTLDNVIPEVEAYQHIAWVYAFRFLRVSLSLQIPSHPETSSALQHLHAISALAEKQGDRAIFVTSAALEAMVHLRIPGSDSIEQAQRAIASARSFQLETSVKELGQIVALVDFLDLMCSLQHYVPDQAAAKMTAMQKIMDQAVLASTGKDNGTFNVLVDRSSGGQLTASTGGIFTKTADGRDHITFSWLHRRDLYSLAYYLSGVTSHLRNEDRAENYLREGIKLIRESLDLHEPVNESMAGASSRIAWRILMDWHMRLHLAFIACSRADWSSAEATLVALRETAKNSFIDSTDTLPRLATYLSGVVNQGKGLTDLALSTYQLPILALPASNARPNDAHTDIAILAAMNSLLLIRDPSHPQHYVSDTLLAQLDPICLAHPNKAIVSAYFIIQANTKGKDSIVKTKHCIQSALQAAKSIANQQLLCISMNLMTATFFTDIVGEQAEKSAKAGRLLAKRCKDDLWVCVADGMLVDTLEKHGKMQEAQVVRQEMLELRAKLPETLRGG